MKKKISIVFVIILILFNFIFNISYAEETTVTPGTTDTTTTTTTTTGTDKLMDSNLDISGASKGIMKDLSNSEGEITSTVTAKQEDGSFEPTETTTVKQDLKKYVGSSSGPIIGIFTRIWAFLLGGWINNIPQFIVEATGNEVINDQFTIYDLVMGNYKTFNLNFSNMDYSIANKEDSDLKLMEKLTKNVLAFYGRMRNLSLAISLFVLLYIAIRMALANVADSRAKYQNMLLAWFTSVCLIFFMHYLIIILSYVSGWALGAVRDLAEIMGVTNIEGQIVKGEFTTLQNNASGFHLFQTLIMVTIFVYYEIKFLIAYIKRFFEMLFLITIAPLVTVTYAIDKVGDNRAQAFQTWFKELINKYVIQIVHAIMYVLFISAAGAIAENAPIIAAFFLWGMGKAENTMRNVIGLSGTGHFQKAKPPSRFKLPGFLRGRRPHA